MQPLAAQTSINRKGSVILKSHPGSQKHITKKRMGDQGKQQQSSSSSSASEEEPSESRKRTRAKKDPSTSKVVDNNSE